jgi:hypothetical protein
VRCKRSTCARRGLTGVFAGFIEETKRLYGVLQIRLAERDWLAGTGKGERGRPSKVSR